MIKNITINILLMIISVSYGFDLSKEMIALGGDIYPQILEVNDKNEVTKSINCEITGNIVNTDTGVSWKLETVLNPAPECRDAIDAEFTWTLLKGEARQTAVAVSFEFKKWATENYVFAPAMVYNGNRFDVKKIPWPTYLLYEDKTEHRIDAPTMINQCPHLNKSGAGRIDLEIGNVSTPLIGFQSPETTSGWMVQTTQGNRLGNHGLMIEEGSDHKKASFSITSPSIRQKRADGSYLRSPSGDKARDWKAGDSATINAVFMYLKPLRSMIFYSALW